jgi:hypothetical protein
MVASRCHHASPSIAMNPAIGTGAAKLMRIGKPQSLMLVREDAKLEEIPGLGLKVTLPPSPRH